MSTGPSEGEVIVGEAEWSGRGRMMVVGSTRWKVARRVVILLRREVEDLLRNSILTLLLYLVVVSPASDVVGSLEEVWNGAGREGAGGGLGGGVTSGGSWSTMVVEGERCWVLKNVQPDRLLLLVVQGPGCVDSNKRIVDHCTTGA